MSAYLKRAQILSRQRRYHLAEKELRQELAQAPQNAETHAFLAEILAEQKKFDDALQEAEMAVHLAPDNEYSHYALARVLYKQRRLGAAEQAIQEALRLDPNNAINFAMLGFITYLKGKWETALLAAENGLRCDPQHVDCNNLRVMALMCLRESQQAETAIATALPHNPENAVLHASRGWLFFRQKEYDESFEHFREALRLKPDYDWAQEGILYTVKANSRLHHLFQHTLKDLPIEGETLSQINFFVVGIPILIYVFRDELQKASSPLLVLAVYFLAWSCVVFWILTWYSAPFLNWIVYLHPFGRLVLSENQRRAASWVPICIGLGVLGLLLWLFTDNNRELLFAIGASAMIQPITTMIECENKKRRRVHAVYTAFLAIVGMLALSLNFFFALNLASLIVTFFVGLFLFHTIAEDICDRLNL